MTDDKEMIPEGNIATPFIPPLNSHDWWPRKSHFAYLRGRMSRKWVFFKLFHENTSI